MLSNISATEALAERIRRVRDDYVPGMYSDDPLSIETLPLDEAFEFIKIIGVNCINALKKYEIDQFHSIHPFSEEVDDDRYRYYCELSKRSHEILSSLVGQRYTDSCTMSLDLNRYHNSGYDDSFLYTRICVGINSVGLVISGDKTKEINTNVSIDLEAPYLDELSVWSMDEMEIKIIECSSTRKDECRALFQDAPSKCVKDEKMLNVSFGDNVQDVRISISITTQV